MRKRLTGSILVFIPREGYNEAELKGTVMVLRKAGKRIFFLSDAFGVCKGSGGGRVQNDVRPENVHEKNFDALILIGGSGLYRYIEDISLQKICGSFSEAGKVIGAICAAPAVLSAAGLLEGKKAACHVSVRDHLRSGGALIVDGNVSSGGGIVTAAGENDAEVFAKQILFEIEQRLRW